MEQTVRGRRRRARSSRCCRPATSCSAASSARRMVVVAAKGSTGGRQPSDAARSAALTSSMKRPGPGRASSDEPRPDRPFPRRVISANVAKSLDAAGLGTPFAAQATLDEHMKLTIERAALLKALGHVQSVVERRNTIPILSNVLLSARSGTAQLLGHRSGHGDRRRSRGRGRDPRPDHRPGPHPLRDRAQAAGRRARSR